jgi:hypothetical protein
MHREGVCYETNRIEPDTIYKNYSASFIKWDDFDPGMLIGRVTCSVINVFS